MGSRRSGPRHISLDEAWSALAGALRPIRPRRLPLEACLGLRVAKPIVVASPVPPSSVAAVDGFAVRAAALHRADGRITLPADSHRVAAGVAISEDCDAVVPAEHVQSCGGGVFVQRAVGRGEHVEPRGSQFRAGEQVVESGALLGPLALGLLASVGERTALVHPRPRVAIVGALPTRRPRRDRRSEVGGAEIVLLRALVEDAGGETISVDGLPAPARTLAPTLAALATVVDLVVVTSGASRGCLEAVLDALQQAGRPIVRDPAILPARHTSAWIVGRRPVLVLAGSLPDLVVGFEALGRPALRRLAGDPGAGSSCVEVVTRSRIVHHPGRTEFVPVRLEREGSAMVAAASGWPQRPNLRSASRSDGLAVLGPTTASVPAGSPVCVRTGEIGAIGLIAKRVL
jgi:molybdopterin molybdotransferase